MIEPELFARRVARLRPKLFVFASHWASDEDAEDAVAEGLLRAWSRLPSYRDEKGDAGLFHWLKVFVRHVLLEASEWRQYHPEETGISAATIEEIEGSRHAEDPTLDAAIASMQRDIDRRSLIWLMGEAELAPAEWECLVARLHGEETADTAARLNLKPGTVREYVRRAIVRLRSCAHASASHVRTRVEYPENK